MGAHGTEKERGHVIKGMMSGKREREGQRISSAPETLAGGREIGEGRRLQTKPGLVLPGEAGCSLGWLESDQPALKSQGQHNPEVPHLGHIHSWGPFLPFPREESRNHLA